MPGAAATLASAATPTHVLWTLPAALRRDLQKLAEGEILPPPPHTEIGASAWNHAGTFEERDCTAWAKEQLGALLRAVEQQPGAGGVSVRITELASCNGEAHQWIFRQKKRAGFEFRCGGQAESKHMRMLLMMMRRLCCWRRMGT